MERKLRRELKDKYEAEIRKAARHLLTGADEAETAAAVKRVEGYAAILNASKPNRELLWASGVALLCITAAGFLWSLHLTDSKFLLSLRSGALRVGVSKKWSQQESFAEGRLTPGGEIQIANSDEIKIAGKQCGSSLTLAGGAIQLTGVSLEARSELELTAEQDYLNVFIKRSAAQGEFTYVGGAQPEDGTNPCFKEQAGAGSAKVPENISFSFAGSGAAPLSLKIRPPIAWPLRNLEVDSMDFSQEQPPGSGEFETTIKKGSVTVYDSDSVHELREGDRLKLDEVNGKCAKIWAEDGINLLCELNAKNILLGPKGAEKNLTPTYLEYLYHKKPLGFLWSAVVFLWGILWGVRQFFRR